MADRGPRGAVIVFVMSRRTGRVPRWLGAGVLVGIPLVLVMTAGLVVGSHLQSGCGPPSPPVAWAVGLLAVVSAGAAVAGWFGSEGVSAGRGCLAGAVTGLVVAAALIAAPLAGLVPQQTCGTPPASIGPQLASIQVQSAVFLIVEVVVLTGWCGLLAAVIRSRASRRSGRGGTSAGSS